MTALPNLILSGAELVFSVVNKLFLETIKAIADSLLHGYTVANLFRNLR